MLKEVVMKFYVSSSSGYHFRVRKNDEAYCQQQSLQINVKNFLLFFNELFV